MTAKKDANEVLVRHAEALRKKLPPAEQGELFRVAVEVGCLAAFGDLEVDPAEREAIVRAVGLLSVGNVDEWEADALVDECAKRIATDGIEARVEAVGAALKRLGEPEGALSLAVLVADASSGVDHLERGILDAIAEAAGVEPSALDRIVAAAGGGA
jgi:tellurite resistance protein